MAAADPNPLAASTVRTTRLAVAACVALLLLYTALAWSARSYKSPTYDEPYHAVAGWTHLRFHDYRLDSEDPPLWQLYAALPNGRRALSADFHSSHWLDVPARFVTQWVWCVDTLYRTPGNDPATFIARSQAMMLGVAVALGALTARWAWQVGGPVAAVVTTTLFALDPGLLGYGPLVKNDVAFTLTIAWLCYALWRLGRRPSAGWMLAIAVICAAMLTTKFSGVLAGAIVPIILMIRVLSRRPWCRHDSRRSRVVIVTSTIALTAVISYIGIWAVYGFRFGPSNDPSIRLNTNELAAMATFKAYAAAHDGRAPDATVLATLAAPPSVRLERWAESHRLLPQPWLAGLLFTYQSALVRPAFLLGHISATGWWYYFPLAMLFKTPIATLAAVALAAVIGIALLRRSASSPRWAAVCLLVPVAIYMVSAMHSNLNIGVRHVLPVWPLLMIAAGVVAAASLRRWRRATIGTLVVLGCGLLAETLHAYPDYVAFFNTAAGGERGGIGLLGDSNLDWGQDLPSLARWQKQHGDRPLYLAYFGLADPAWYGVKYTPLPGGYRFDPPPSWPSRGLVTVAISATYLQGVLVDPELYDTFYARFAHRPPDAVLGGTIYLFNIDAR